MRHKNLFTPLIKIIFENFESTGMHFMYCIRVGLYQIDSVFLNSYCGIIEQTKYR